MKLLSCFALAAVLLGGAGCGSKSQVDQKASYVVKYGESLNSVRQSQGVQPLPAGWDCTVTETQIAWTAPNQQTPGFIGKTVTLTSANGSVKTEEDAYLLSNDMPRNAITIISQFDGDKVTGQTARKETATPEGKPVPIEDAKKQIKAVVK